jgi:hypothetical protein
MTGSRILIGVLIALVVGLTAGLVIATGNDGDDETTDEDTITFETEATEPETETTETVAPTTTQSTVPDGGTAPPAPNPNKPDSSGGLGVESP